MLAASASASSTSASTSSSPPESLPSVTRSPSPSTNETAVIVGGTIGGLAVLCFIAFAIYVMRNLKSLRSPNAAPAPPLVWTPGSNKEQRQFSNEPNEVTAPSELPTVGEPLELLSGGQHEIAELSNESSTTIRN
ncbi:MAG: hypothetical protein L6R37_004217 [Teloschistes peruensis]|nr:MAG: hypothetical protein L6R37_004217 [Teloschistes peruensis]